MHEDKMAGRAQAQAVAQLKRKLDKDEYREIRQLWMRHSVAEDTRDIPGLMATLTEDCVYTVVNKNHTWFGKEGATQFYVQLLGAFPDIHFDLQNIVIGPQGVFEEARVTATHCAPWLDFAPTGQRVTFDVCILFPWDAEQKLFKGERVYFAWQTQS
jgi:predicted ester cyclase